MRPANDRNKKTWPTGGSGNDGRGIGNPSGDTLPPSQEKGNDFMVEQANYNGANLGFEARLWAAVVKLRGYMEPSDTKQVAICLIFLRNILDLFEVKRAELFE